MLLHHSSTTLLLSGAELDGDGITSHPPSTVRLYDYTTTLLLYYSTTLLLSGAELDGDGITPTFSSIDLFGARTMVLPGVTHYPFTAAPLADIFAPVAT